MDKQGNYGGQYDQSSADNRAFYGLPSDVKFCKNCVISNQRPNSAIEFQHTAETNKETIGFNDDGLCDACRLAELKKNCINWQEREKELEALCNRYRCNRGGYDCLVPGSGGKDSFFAAHILKAKFGMSPLTVTWAPHIYTDWGWRNHRAWINAGFDNYLMTPNGRVHRLLTRLALENLLHPFQPFMIGQKFLAPRLAALFDIPLVFFGESEAEYGNSINETESAKRDWSYFTNSNQSEIFLGGVSVRNLKEEYDISGADLEAYTPIDPSMMEEKKIEVHFLGYYLPWHPQGSYYYAVEHGGFEPSPERTPGTYSKYNSIDDKIDDFHYYTTYIKFGIGRATYDASQEIRNEEITREEGVRLVKKYDGEFPERFSDEIFKYLSITKKHFPLASEMFDQPVIDKTYFEYLVNRFRSPHLWYRSQGQWHLRHTVWDL